MSTYVRPAVESPVFYDAQGQVIEYGSRWPDSPPVDTYSVVTHPERFDPLRAVAEALIAHLQETFEVDIIEGPEAVEQMLRPREDAIRTVRIEPRDPSCAPVTIQIDSYPGVEVEAGLLERAWFPPCGCDACDETWESAAEGLEQLVLAVVDGGFWEQPGPFGSSWVEIGHEHPEGRQSGSVDASQYPAARLEALRDPRRPTSGRWASWPRRRVSPASSDVEPRPGEASVASPR
ncbi:MAG: hypothetical protein GX593_13330 [Actinomycetales bacterium]|nr:hypothetical protein [Actinomycetales bacterium]